MAETSTDKQSNKYGITLQAVIPMRREPDEKSEMVSQLLFGECYRVEQILDRWLSITTGFDNYMGWIDQKTHTEITPGDYSQYNSGKIPVLASKIGEIILADGSPLFIPAGSGLPGFNGSGKIFSNSEREMRIQPHFGNLILPPSQKISETALQFLNAPYLWGGRSTFGLDCAGFVQTIYKIHGISLPRDTDQQAISGMEIHHVNEIQPGDLAFFASGKDKINHTGMILSEGEIIHCSGWVRIDRFDSKGIFNRTTGKHTHQLQVIRRISH